MKVINTSGSRKQARARASLKDGKGIVRINGHALDQFSNAVARMRISEPLVLAGDVVKSVNIDVSVQGGGWSSQADAIRVAIARSLAEHNKPLRKTFLDYDRLLLINDVRRNETSKPNDSKPRAKRQKSYR